uniref:Uncharacterized protein n=1 Tax=Mycobacterium riyadhense TaxID=486698 RepID=A0A653F295_9MYCO|nr:hypothetical protein BIN_B_05240 [Mycobacterium riyadhense]
MAWVAAPAARAAAALSHPAYGAAAVIIACEAGPCQAWLANADVIEANESAAEPNSAANPSHPRAACSIGADPAPVNIRNELISGGNTEKFITTTPSQRQHPCAGAA